MNFYQLGYFRTGKQEADAGWKLVSASAGMDYNAINGFMGISANLVELKKVSNVPTYTLGIFQYERFVYIIHINYAASGSDARGVSYVHGYCFNLKEYYELCIAPERLFGIQESNYVKEYDSSVKEYPIQAELSYDRMDYVQLMKKYGFTDEEYNLMIKSVICALAGFTMPLCIKYAIPLEQYKQVYKELLYLIMRGIPYHMRIKITGYSYKGSNAVIYLSDMVEGDNYIDLDSKTFVCDYSRLEPYQFVLFCKSLNNGSENRVIQKTAEIMNNIYENPIYETDINKVEAAFQRLVTSPIDPQKAVRLLEFLLNCNLTEHDKVYVYLKSLLKVINNYQLMITDEKVFDQLNIRFERCNDNNFRQEICSLYARFLLGEDEEKAFGILNGLSYDFPEEYKLLCKTLEEKDEEFYKRYWFEKYLPAHLSSFDSVYRYLMDNQDLDIDEYYNVLTIILDISLEGFKEAQDFQSLYDIKENAEDLISLYPKGIKQLEQYKKDFVENIRFHLWESFNLEEFDPIYINMYKICDVEKVNRIGYSGKICRSAQCVWALIGLFEEGVTVESSEHLIEILYLNDFILSVDAKERIQRFLLDEKLEDCDLSTQEGFDYSLLLFYSFKNEKFDTLSWFKRVENQGLELVFQPDCMERYIKNSNLLCLNRVKDILASSIENDIKGGRNNHSRKHNKKQLAGLKQLYLCLIGKTDTKQQTKRGKNVLYMLHRIPVGMFALVAIIFGLMCLHKYTKLAPAVLYMVTLAAALVCGGAAAMKIIFNDGIDNLIKHIKLRSIPHLLLYLGTFLVVAVIISVIYLLNGLLAKLAGIFILSTLSVISVIAYGIIQER